MTIEAMKQALEALNLARAAHGQMLLSDPPQEAWKAWNVNSVTRIAMDTLRQAIEQAEKQEPAVWVRTNGINNSGVAHYGPTCPPGWIAAAKPYYTTPQPQREWVGLTHQEVAELLERGDVAESNEKVGWYVLPYSFAQAIEAKLKEKNT